MANPVVYECWARCEDCQVDLPRVPYTATAKGHTAHETTGMVAGTAQGHLEAHPDHRVTYHRERSDLAAERRAREARAEKREHAARVVEAAAMRKEMVARILERERERAAAVAGAEFLARFKKQRTP